MRELLLGRPGVFITPETCVREVWENRKNWNRKKIPEALVKEALDFLTEEFVGVVPRSAYREREDEAANLIPDPDDVPVVALALAGTTRAYGPSTRRTSPIPVSRRGVESWARRT